MPPLTVAALANLMADSAAVDDAFLALRSQLDEVSRGLGLAYLRYDIRRQLVVERLSVVAGDVTREPAELSLDHLPARTRRELLAGGTLVDFGDQSADYGKLLGLSEPPDGFLLVQAIRCDGELCGLIALREPRQLFGSRAVERVAAPVGLFAMAVVHCVERDARREAESALEELLARVHAEYGRTLFELRRELEDAQRQLSGGADYRVAELERAANAAAGEARAAFARLEAVEEQVQAAVSQLEKAHLDLSRQSDALRNQSALLHRIERLLSEGASAEDPQRVLNEVLAAVSSR